MPNETVVHNRGVTAEIHDAGKAKDVDVDVSKTETTKTTEQVPAKEVVKEETTKTEQK